MENEITNGKLRFVYYFNNYIPARKILQPDSSDKHTIYVNFYTALKQKSKNASVFLHISRFVCEKDLSADT